MAVAGVDTWSVCWYLRAESRAALAAERLATVPNTRFRGFEDQVDGHTVLYNPGSRLLAVEGHPGGEERLAPLAELPGSLERLVSGLGDLGVSVPPYDYRPSGSRNRTARGRGDSGFGGVRRLDLTCDIERSAVIGSALLKCVAAVEPQRCLRSDVYRSRRGRAIETVAWKGGRRTVARVYDKGVERGHAVQRGQLIRFEDQRRFDKGSRPTVEMVREGYGAMLFRARFGVLRHATRGVTVTSLDGLVERVQELVETGDLSPSQATKLVGSVVIESAGVEFGSRTTRWRQRDFVRRGGLLLADGVLEADEVFDLGDELDEVIEVPWDAS